MKVVLLNIIFLIVLRLLAITTVANAQDSIGKKADFANWVIESNVNTPKISVIKFYNAKQELIYQEQINGKTINVNRSKVQKRLNEVLVKLTKAKADNTSYNLVAASLKVN